MTGAFPAKGGVVFPSKRVRRVDNRLARTDEMGGRACSRRTKRGMPRNRLAGAGTEGRGAADVVGDISRGYTSGRVAASTRKAYEANWRL